MNYYISILASIGVGTALGFALIKFFAKNLFETYLLRNLEKYKNDLEKQTIVHQIQFASLHKERADLIKKLYQLIVDYKSSVMNIVYNESSSKEELQYKLDTWGACSVKFLMTFQKNRIFFPESLCQLFEELNLESGKVYLMIGEIIYHNPTVESQIIALKSTAFQAQCDKIIEGAFHEIEQKLENEFRTLIGVH